MQGKQLIGTLINKVKDLRLLGSIRERIIVPYLVLTMTIAVIGIYFMLNMVTTSLDERLDRYLIDSGRTVANSMVDQEINMRQDAQLIGSLGGVPEALQRQNYLRLERLVLDAIGVTNVNTVLIVDAEGNLALHLLAREDGTLEAVKTNDFEPRNIESIQALLNSGDPEATPKRGIGQHPANERFYYFISLPIGFNDELAGIVMVGTSMETLLPKLRSSSLADIVIYQERSPIPAASTFFIRMNVGATDEVSRTEIIESLVLPPEILDQIVESSGVTTFYDTEVNGQPFRFAFGRLQISNEILGAFGVALPSDFVNQTKSTSRTTYLVIVGVGAFAVLGLGWVISQSITEPLFSLMRTSQAVAEGDLKQRTGVDQQDEIGILARTFDEMTERLEDRSQRLEELLQAYKETASRMRAILSSIGDGVLLEDNQGNFIPLNAAAESMLEELSHQFLRGPLREISVPDQEEVEGDIINPWLLESRRFQIADKVFTVYSAGVVAGEDERLGTVIVLRDVTAEMEVQQLKDAFVAHVSHELRTPLTSIKGYSSLLLSSASSLSGEQRNFLERIVRHTDDLISMINALLDFSEIEASGRLGLRQKPQILIDLVESVVEQWRPKMDDKELDFELDIISDIPYVNADSARLRWAIANLIRNAWQYTPEGGSVTLRISSHDDRVILDVVDTGVGIPLEDQRRLFSRFYRVTDVREDEGRGLGLGLYITKAIIEAHGGYIQVFSEEGVGSTFSVVLPVLRHPESVAVGGKK